MTNSFDKFRLLLWKNFKIHSRHKKQILFEIAFPLLFTVILILVRDNFSTVNNPAVEYYEFVPESDCNPWNEIHNYNSSSVIAYSPSDNPKLREIVKSVKSTLESAAKFTYQRVEFKISEQNNSTELDNFAKLNNPFVALEFDDDLKDLVKLDYTIRFIGEDQYWHTDVLTAVNKLTRKPLGDKNKEGNPAYNARCFMAIQNSIDRAFMKILGGKDEEKKIVMKRFPHPAYITDNAFEFSNQILPIFIVMSFMYTVRNIIKDVALEKEKQLKESLKIVGLPNWLHWSAWFTKTLIYLLIILTAMTFMLTSPLVTSNQQAVLSNSNPFLLWLFMLFYTFGFITFCFLMTLPFKKATTCGTIGFLLYFFSYYPYALLLNRFHTFPYLGKMGLCLITNSAMGFGFNTILKMEVNGVGLQWSNFFSQQNENNFSFFDVMLSMLLGAIFNMLLTLYIEQVFPGQFGIPKKWYFPLEKCCGKIFKRNYNSLRESVGEDSKKVGDTFEDEPTDQRAGVKIRNLTKIFSAKKAVVNKLYMNMYEDQITVLLGHNGAGKTTTMSMLTGLFPPTEGTAFIDGKDIRFEIDEVRESLGLCPQHNVLFDELTVKEHITFFSRLKGLSGKDVKEEVRKYVRLLELDDKINAQSHTLSGGMKRKLSIALALCGKSKIVMLDEPTSGMDPAARRKLWDLLIEEKHGRTMLLTTHFMDEADVLGDRIGVMAEGEMKAIGSSFFLKKRFGVGYRLVCVKNQNCKPQEVTDCLREFIPEIKIETDIGTELTYILNELFISKFQKMFAKLESNSEELGISSYGVSLTTMEEVFLKIGVDAHALERRTSGGSVDLSDQVNVGGADDVESGRETKLTGPSLLLNQLNAMLKKRFYFTIRNYKVLIWNFIFSILAVILSLRTSTQAFFNYPPLKMSIDSYSGSITVFQDTANDPVLAEYQKIFKDQTNLQIVPPQQNIEDFLLSKYNQSFDETNRKYVIGISADSDKITAWYNGDFFHAMPLSLNSLNRALLKQKYGDQYDLSVTNHPFHYTANNSDHSMDQIIEMMKSIFLIFFLIMIFTNWTSQFISFYIKERVSRAKLLQIISGVDKTIFWLSSYLFDFVIMILVSLTVIATIAVFQQSGFSTFMELFRLFLIFAAFALAALPFTYLFSHLFTQSSTGESMNTLLGLTTGLVLYAVYFSLSMLDNFTGRLFKQLYWVFLFSPHFTLCDALGKLMYLNLLEHPMKNAMETQGISKEEMCKEFPLNCINYWDFKDGIAGDLVAFLIVATFYLILLLMKEYHIFQQLFYKLWPQKALPPLNEHLDNDVKEEVEKVNQMSAADIATQNMVVVNLSKYYGNFLAVNRICFAVPEASCFGLLGANGAGKTSVFKMLTGDEIISVGDAYVTNLSIKNQLNLVHKKIGYCPQFDALLEDLTGFETMQIFCLLRGIPRQKIDRVCKNLAEVLNFDHHLSKKIKTYSGGNKRKLSTALALIGDPELIFLDEPTTGMDPGAKRKLWDVIIKMRSQGKSVILTSHSMEECEALCTKLAIMVHGEFKCLGSTQHLKNKFSKGYILSIKAGRRTEAERISHIARVKQFVAHHFKDAKLKEEFLDILTYQIENTDLKWSEMFGLMESQKVVLEIDDYSIGQTSLEQVFLFFTKSTILNQSQ